MPSLQLNLEGGQLFCITEIKGPHEWPGHCYEHLFTLEVVTVMMLINPCCALSGDIFGTEKAEENSNFVILVESGMSG